MRRQILCQHGRGFTLVELLVVVLIVTILATVVLFAMFSATETARAARTSSMIARINDLIIPMWESYMTRRVPISIAASRDPIDAARDRLDGLRELMRMEMPDRKSDVEVNPVTLANRPPLSSAYMRMATQQVAGNDINNWTTEYQGSECLYLIMARINDGYATGLEFVRETEITDLDNDGMPEIVDGWGTPIRLLRWAPGFTADVAPTALQKAPANSEPDSFDPLGARGVPPDTFYLFPLVMSAGPDREWDIAFDTAAGINYASTSPANDPYQQHGSPAKYMGSPDDNNSNNGGTPQEHLDNIHNHLISTGAN